MTDAESQFNISNVSHQSTLDSELGHQSLNWLDFSIAKIATAGFFASLTLEHVAQSNDINTRLIVGGVIAITSSAISGISDYTEEISYDHEYAREAWEHEFNPIGEVDEYVAYANTKGVPTRKARDIAMVVTSEPAISIPYHLAFELSLLEPRFYKKKCLHLLGIGGGYFAGFALREAVGCIVHLASRVGYKSMLLNKYSLSVALSSLALTPMLIVGNQPALHVRGSSKFKAVAASVYVGCIFAVVSLGYARKS